MIPKYYYIILIFFTSFTSCTKDVDFNQIYDANVHTTYTSTLVYANFTAINFLDTNNIEIPSTKDSIEAPIDKNILKYLEKVEFTIIINNTFNRGFNFYFNFLDDTKNVVYTLQPTIFVAPNSGEQTFILEIPFEDIKLLNKTRFFEFEFELTESSDGSTLSGTEIGTLDLKSSVKLFYNFYKL